MAECKDAVESGKVGLCLSVGGERNEQPGKRRVIYSRSLLDGLENLHGTFPFDLGKAFLKQATAGNIGEACHVTPLSFAGVELLSGREHGMSGSRLHARFPLVNIR